jgi:hypothetical protein
MSLLEQLAEAHRRAVAVGRDGGKDQRDARAKLLRDCSAQRYTSREMAAAMEISPQRAHELLQDARSES